MFNVFYNYVMKDSGYKLIKFENEVDEDVLIMNPELRDKKQVKSKLIYKPKYRANYVSERLLEVVIGYLGYLIEGRTDGPNRIRFRTNQEQKRENQMRKILELSDDEVVFSRVFKEFMEDYEAYKEKLNDKESLYTKYRIPKRKPKNGKTQYREISEPEEELKNLQKKAAELFEKVLKIQPHEAAHAYREGRDNVTNANMHRFSKHIVNIDLKDFFPSISAKYIRRALAKQFPFFLINLNSEMLDDFLSQQNRYLVNILGYNRDITRKQVLDARDKIREFVEAIVNIATYKGGLPQGSPLSPYLSNLVMFEFDYRIQNELDNLVEDRARVMYTRYADDLTFSSLSGIPLKELTEMVEVQLNMLFDRDIKINPSKTKYLKDTGRCYVTGVKVNKENRATFGHEKKAQLKRDLFQLFMSYKDGNEDRQEARETLGMLAYMHRIEPNYTKKIISKYCYKFGISTNRFYKYFLG